jgi:hypothetical protein
MPYAQGPRGFPGPVGPSMGPSMGPFRDPSREGSSKPKPELPCCKPEAAKKGEVCKPLELLFYKYEDV